MNNKPNSVIAGDFSGKQILSDGIGLFISGAIFSHTKINKSTVLGYSLVNVETRGFRGQSFYTVSLSFADGKSSLVYLDGNYYNCLVKILF